MGGSWARTGLPAAVSTTVYDDANELTTWGGGSLTYDADGNLRTEGTNTYTFDDRDHLSAISGGTTGSFVYDGLGRRMKATIGATTTQYLYDRLNPVQELSGTGTPTANLLTGLGVDDRFSRTDSAGARYFFTDPLASTVALTNSAGTVKTTYTYQPFGTTTTGGTASANPYRFTGREYDSASLYFSRARYYSPAYQRFDSEDPMPLFGGNANAYQYVNNDPSDLTDPLGLFALTDPACGIYACDQRTNQSTAGRKDGKPWTLADWLLYQQDKLEDAQRQTQPSDLFCQVAGIPAAFVTTVAAIPGTPLWLGVAAFIYAGITLLALYKAGCL